MNKPMVHLTIERESAKKRPSFYFFPDDFGLRSPVIQKKIAKKRYTSIVARVFFIQFYIIQMKIQLLQL